VLDVGCGFGDFYRYATEKYGVLRGYTGIELVSALADEGEKRYGSNANFRIVRESIVDWEPDTQFDYVVISGLFNFKLEGGPNANYEFIESVIAKCFNGTTLGLAANFLSDKVDYEYDLTFHSNPGQLLEYCFRLTRNIVFRNDYFPFEFTLILNKDDSFSVEDTVFNSYKGVASD
jgi:SAM-dependent methyltransferase